MGVDAVEVFIVEAGVVLEVVAVFAVEEDVVVVVGGDAFSLFRIFARITIKYKKAQISRPVTFPELVSTINKTRRGGILAPNSAKNLLILSILSYASN